MLAMSLGRPVIAPRLPGLAELIVDGENGLLFDPRAEGGLAAALARACEIATPRLQHLSEAAFHAAMCYDWRMIGNLWSGLLHRLIARTPLRRIDLARMVGEHAVLPGIG